MATPLFSKQMSITIDGSALGCTSDFSLSIDRDLIEIACMNTTGFKQSVPDLKQWSISFSGLVMTTPTVDAGKKSYYDLMSNMIDGDASLAVAVVPDVTGNIWYSGTGYLSSVSMDGGVGSAITYSGEVTGDGTLDSSIIA